jgi:hypothetical protein
MILDAVARQGAKARKMMQLLHELRGSEVLVAAVQGSTAMMALLLQQITIREIPKNVFMAAAKNTKDGAEIMALLCRVQCKSRITKQVFKAAFANNKCVNAESRLCR